MNSFIDKFNKKHPPQENQDHWIDLVVTGINGSIHNETNDLEID